MKTIIDVCECPDCQEADTPCAMDCDPDEMCEGCRLAAQDLADTQASIDLATGRL